MLDRPLHLPNCWKIALEPYQEKALASWKVQMHNWNLPPTAGIIQAWANRALARARQNRQVSKMWFDKARADVVLCTDSNSRHGECRVRTLNLNRDTWHTYK
jgi:hypothetical protein